MRTGGLRNTQKFLLLLVVGVTIAVVLSLRKPAPEHPLRSADPNVPQGDKAEGVKLCRVVGANEDWCLTAQKEYGQKDGQRDWRGDAVFTTTYVANGVTEKMSVSSDRCLVNPTPLEAQFEGNVHVVTSQAIELTSNRLSYLGEQNLAATDDRVEFKRKRMRGSAIGFRYNAQEGRLEFLSDVEFIVDDAVKGPLRVRGNSAVYLRAEDSWEMSGDILMERGDARLTAGALNAKSETGSGLIRELVALQNVEVASSGQVLRNEGVVGAADGSYHLTTNRLHIRMHDSGAPAEMQAGPGGAVLKIVPARGLANERRQFSAGGFMTVRMDPNGRVEELEARKDVVYQVDWDDARAASPADRQQHVECKWMVLRMNPENGEVRQGEFDRDVVFMDRGRRASSDWAQYLDSKLQLKGSPKMDGADGSRLRADTIILGFNMIEGNIWAHGDVSHNVRLAGGDKPGLLSKGQALITAADFAYEAKSRTAIYRKHARLTSEGDEIAADEITLAGDEKAMRVDARTDVLTKWRDRAQESNQAKPIVVRAQQMRYDDAKARIEYRGKVEFQRQELIARTSENLSMDLDRQNALSRLALIGPDVEVVYRDGSAQGRRAVYTPSDGALVLRGAPAIFKDSSSLVRGLLLTLAIDANRIQMGGLNRQRTGSKFNQRTPTPTPTTTPAATPAPTPTPPLK